ncbi:MAG: SDR family oxidoreductase [Capsulimonas sp.]|uniref:SDR family oxidoreductase n=1 Tax=Capsulimonas sp. TaxID=2494211 RepID=UPI0032636611
MPQKVLFIGGTGIISSACSQLAVERGVELYLLNRGRSSRPVPEGARVLHGDIRDPESARAAIQGLNFDSIVDWVAFTPEHVQTDIDLFTGRTSQYVFISSASAYQKPVASLPITESTVLSNPYWEYSRNKIACEELLVRAYREQGFPSTIVRPSHTYDQRLLPFMGGWTEINRMRQGKKIMVHGDGTSLWVMTHHRDFAKGFLGLLGNPRTIGDAIQITSDEALTWNQIYEIFAHASGATAKMVYVPSATIGKHFPEWNDGLIGDRTNSVIFDNTKVKRLVPDFAATIPLSWGAQEVIDWYDADPARQVVDVELDARIDKLIAAQEAV